MIILASIIYLINSLYCFCKTMALAEYLFLNSIPFRFM